MAKKFKCFFYDKLNYFNLYNSYLYCKKGKCYRDDVILFSLKYEFNLSVMLKKLENNNYVFGGYKLFYVYEPKKRKILAAKFIDRIVHTWYVKYFIEDIFVPTFITTSYACISGRGMHKCVKDVYSGLFKYDNGYILKMDILKFFNNINRDILFNIICKKVYDKYFLSLTKSILDSSSEYDEVVGVGLPIGNYTSQMFANIYMNEIDQFCKHFLKCKYYFRYMDDTVIICKDKLTAKYYLSEIESFLNRKLNLKLNDKTSIFKISQGVNFCGYKINRKGIKIRNNGKKKLIKKLKYIEYSLRYTDMDIDQAKELLNGHIGYIKHASIGGLINKYFG